MSTHTPGPWTACRKGECRCGFIWGADGDTHVASVHGPRALGTDYYGSDIACSEDTQKANIRLIAAAPELLEALKRAQLVMNSIDDSDLPNEMKTALLVFRAVGEAAIAKAEGR